MEVFAIYASLFASLGTIGDIFWYIWLLVIPPFLYWIFHVVWTDYAIGSFVGGTDFEMLEIIPPGDIEMSPQPMELIFAAIQGVYTTPSTYDFTCNGVTTLPFSLELVGIEGRVHFYIRFPGQFRALLESHIYAQYPGVELKNVSHDYTAIVPAIIPNKEWDLWGTDLELVAPDPVPIKTWQNFEENITGKMIDPLAGLIEVMGSTRKGEHLWMQILATPQKETWYNTGKLYADELKGKATKQQKGIIGKVINGMTGFLGVNGSGGVNGDESPLEFRLSPGERKVLEAVEENIGRYVFETKMRMIYIGRKEVFNKTVVSGFFGAIKQFADFNLNSFKPNDASKTYANYAFRKVRSRYKQRKILDRYRERSRTGAQFFLSDRELATIYHMPDMSVAAPSLMRTSVVQSTAPANLPVEQNTLSTES